MIELMERRRINTKSLPYYYKVEYIGGTGAQRIRLPLSVVAGDAFGVILDFVHKSTTTQSDLFRASTYNQFNAYIYSYNGDANSVTFATTIGQKSGSGGITITNDVRNTIELSTTKKSVNGVDTLLSRPLRSSITYLDIMYSGIIADIYSIIVYHNDQNIYELCPVVKNGVGCFYNEISGNFYYNEGSGSFVVGPRI